MHDQDNSHASMSTPSNCQIRTKKEDTPRFKKGTTQSAATLREMSPKEQVSLAGGHLSTNRAGSEGDKLFITDILQNALSVKEEESGELKLSGESINEERNNVSQKFSVDGENSVTYNEAISPSLESHGPGNL